MTPAPLKFTKEIEAWNSIYNYIDAAKDGTYMNK